MDMETAGMKKRPLNLPVAAESSTSSSATVHESPTAAPDLGIIPNPQLHQAIYAYFLSIHAKSVNVGGTAAGAAASPPINTQPVLGAIRQTFPTESSNFAALLSPDGRGVCRNAAPCAAQLVHRFRDYDRLAARVGQLEKELQVLRGGGGGGTAAGQQPTVLSGSTGGVKEKTNQSRQGQQSDASAASTVADTGTEVSAKRSRQASAQPMTMPSAAAAAASPAAPSAASTAPPAPLVAAAPVSSPSIPNHHLATATTASMTSKSWSDLYADLEHFRAGYGHCRVPTRYPHNQELAKWVQSMRQAYKAYRLYEEATGDAQDIVDDDRAGRLELTPTRKQKLEDIGFEWSVYKKEAKPWSVRYQDLVEYKNKHGNCRVPRTYKPNPQLGEWVKQQRTKYNKMHQSNPKGGGLSHDKIMKLEEIGFEWAVGAKKQSWEQRFEALVEFRRMNGHVNIFANFDDSVVTGDKNSEDFDANRTGDKTKAHMSLVQWASYQRTEYRKMISGHHSRLTKAKVKRLEDIGFDIAGPKELQAKPYVRNPKRSIGPRVTWDERFKQLIQYRSEFGHCRVPQGWSPNPSLNIWVNEQRRNYRLKQEGRLHGLDDEKKRRLEEIGFEFRVKVKKAASSGDADRQDHVVGLHYEDDDSDSDEYASEQL